MCGDGFLVALFTLGYGEKLKVEPRSSVLRVKVEPKFITHKILRGFVSFSFILHHHLPRGGPLAFSSVDSAHAQIRLIEITLRQLDDLFEIL